MVSKILNIMKDEGFRKEQLEEVGKDFEEQEKTEYTRKKN